MDGQASLSQSQQEYENLINSIDGIVWKAEARPLRFTFVSPQVERILGYSVEQWLNTPDFWAQHIHPDDREWAVRYCAQATAEKRSHQFEYRMIAADGRTVWLRDLVSVEVEGDQLARLSGVLIDITERKRNEQEISRLNQDLERRTRELAAINRASQAMASTVELAKVLELVINEIKSLVDAEDASVLLQDGQELVFVATANSFTGPAVGTRMPVTAGIAGWVMQHGRAALVSEAHRDPRFYDQIDAATGVTTHSLLAVPLVVKGVIRGVIEAINQASGAFDGHDLEMLAAVAGPAAIAIENARLFAAVDKELFERERAEMELERRNQDLTTLNAIAATIGQSPNLDHILNATLEQVLQVTRMEGGLILLLEDDGTGLALAAHRGLPRLMIERVTRQRLGEGILGQIALSGQPYVADDIAQVLGFGTSHAQGVKGVMRAFAGVPIRSKDRTLGVLAVAGAVPRVVALQEQQLLTAIGHQVGIAVENARLAEQAAETQTLRELDRFRSELVANVSHELRTPLGLIKVFATTLLRDDVTFDRDILREFLSDIEKETDRLEKIVDNLLDLSRMQSGRMQLERQPADLGELIRRVMQEPGVQLAPHGFVCDVPAEPLVVSVDARRIEQVLRNLLSNAIKYSPGGGTITIQARGDERQTLVRVSDQGIGIPPSDQAKVFERFYRVENEVTRRVGGVGLGLAVCQGIVEAHGGRIWVESWPGKGSTFYVTLPANLHESQGSAEAKETRA